MGSWFTTDPEIKKSIFVPDNLSEGKEENRILPWVFHDEENKLMELKCIMRGYNASNNPSDYQDARWSHPGFDDDQVDTSEPPFKDEENGEPYAIWTIKIDTSAADAGIRRATCEFQQGDFPLSTDFIFLIFKVDEKDQQEVRYGYGLGRNNAEQLINMNIEDDIKRQISEHYGEDSSSVTRSSPDGQQFVITFDATTPQTPAPEPAPAPTTTPTSAPTTAPTPAPAPTTTKPPTQAPTQASTPASTPAPTQPPTTPAPTQPPTTPAPAPTPAPSPRPSPTRSSTTKRTTTKATTILTLNNACEDVAEDPNFYLRPHPSDCGKFIMCQPLGGGRYLPQVMLCAPGTYYDRRLTTCNHRCYQKQSINGDSSQKLFRRKKVRGVLRHQKQGINGDSSQKLIRRKKSQRS